MRETSDGARRLRRILLNAAMVAWFLAVAFWFGPNVILFGKLTRMAPVDFVPLVERDCIPAVRAIKIYQRTNGRMPASVDELGPALSNPPASGSGFHIIDGGRPYSYWAVSMYNHQISYDFTPGHEGWFVHGVFANGPIPVAPVTIDSHSTTAP